jgi:hypothetical protein
MDNHALLRSGGGRLFPNLHVNHRHLAKRYRYPTDPECRADYLLPLAECPKTPVAQTAHDLESN